MPGGNRMGPAGLGPMTGRCIGYCAGYKVPGSVNRLGCSGIGGFGRGRGYRNIYYMTGLPAWARYGGFAVYRPGPEDEKAFLNDRQKALEEELKMIREQLKRMEDQGSQAD
jgi:hypothetical protein